MQSENVKPKRVERRTPEQLAKRREGNRLRYAEGTPEYKAAICERAETNRLKRKYGLTPEERDALSTKQDDCCAICGREAWTQRYGKLHVDHDHETGKVRAMLCYPCNSMIGYSSNDPAVLERAAAYLREHACPSS